MDWYGGRILFGFTAALVLLGWMTTWAWEAVLAARDRRRCQHSCSE